ncbi:MAG: ABC transporter ATP-binding protein, partial [Deferrisomatales bacterium]
EENLAVAHYALKGRPPGAPRGLPAEAVYEYFPRLRERRRQRAGYLSGGEQQMLAVGRALIAGPRLLLLDEPSLGLAPLLVEEIFTILRRINAEQKLTMLLVEQNAAMALHVAHYGYIMEGGKVVLDGPTKVLLKDADVQEFYLGVRSGHGETSFREVKHYKRRKRWLS